MAAAKRTQSAGEILNSLQSWEAIRDEAASSNRPWIYVRELVESGIPMATPFREFDEWVPGNRLARFQGFIPETICLYNIERETSLFVKLNARSRNIKHHIARSRVLVGGYQNGIANDPRVAIFSELHDSEMESVMAWYRETLLPPFERASVKRTPLAWSTPTNQGRNHPWMKNPWIMSSDEWGETPVYQTAEETQRAREAMLEAQRAHKEMIEAQSQQSFSPWRMAPQDELEFSKKELDAWKVGFDPGVSRGSRSVAFLRPS